MKDTVRQRDLYCTHYIAIFIRDTTKTVVVRGSPRRTGARRQTYPAVSRCSQGTIITPFLKTT
jgi:hypothetical protein